MKLRRITILFMAVAVLMTSVLVMGCKITDINSDKVSELDFTVVEDKDLPIELKKLIDSKKENTESMKLDDFVKELGLQPDD